MSEASRADATEWPTPRSTRAAAIERRQALCRNGAATLAPPPDRPTRGRTNGRAQPALLSPPDDAGSAETEVDPGCGCQHPAERGRQMESGSMGEPPVALTVAHGRLVAQRRRAERCEVGRGDTPECRPSGRAARRGPVAPKVQVVSTLRGVTVTGTAVGATAEVTGSDAGACRVVTGTEYAGPEDYAELCDDVPAPGAAKVGVGVTGRGQRITGTQVGPSGRVTGDEYGTSIRVTGTEYLGADRLGTLSGRAGSPRAEVSPRSDVSPPVDGLPQRTDRGQLVTGTEVGHSPKVTGDEAGVCQKLTGTQYLSSAWPESICRTSAAPKVRLTTTARGAGVTGTAVGHSSKVTGDHEGACASITGTEYVGLEQYQACNRRPVGGPAKVAVMATWRGQEVSGTAVERSAKVTGDEVGACQPVTGDPYIGPDQYDAHCDPADATAAQARLAGVRRASIVPSGTRAEGGSRVTGSSRGARITVSGTPYATVDGGEPPAGRGRLSGPRSHGPVEPVPAADDLGDASSGARRVVPVGRERSVARITGTAAGGGRRITGPVDLAGGLVSGTPEFRYREDASSPVTTAGPTSGETRRRGRVTGEGRVDGFVVTGSAWRHSHTVTGTEGAFARRNPTLRGEAPAGDPINRRKQPVERPEVPISRVTGSSGCSDKGPLVTYSGGARG